MATPNTFPGMEDIIKFLQEQRASTAPARQLPAAPTAVEIEQNMRRMPKAQVPKTGPGVFSPKALSTGGRAAGKVAAGGARTTLGRLGWPGAVAAALAGPAIDYAGDAISKRVGPQPEDFLPQDTPASRALKARSVQQPTVPPVEQPAPQQAPVATQQQGVPEIPDISEEELLALLADDQPRQITPVGVNIPQREPFYGEEFLNQEVTDPTKVDPQERVRQRKESSPITATPKSAFGRFTRGIGDFVSGGANDITRESMRRYMEEDSPEEQAAGTAARQNQAADAQLQRAQQLKVFGEESSGTKFSREMAGEEFKSGLRTQSAIDVRAAEQPLAIELATLGKTDPNLLNVLRDAGDAFPTATVMQILRIPEGNPEDYLRVESWQKSLADARDQMGQTVRGISTLRGQQGAGNAPTPQQGKRPITFNSVTQ